MIFRWEYSAIRGGGDGGVRGKSEESSEGGRGVCLVGEGNGWGWVVRGYEVVMTMGRGKEGDIEGVKGR